MAAVDVVVGPLQFEHGGVWQQLSCSTDSDGVFRLGLVPSGKMVARIDSAGVAVPFEVMDGERAAEVHLVVPVTTFLRGKVRDTLGQGLGGVELWVTEQGRTLSAASGEFEFKNLRGGNHPVRVFVVRAPGFETGQVLNSVWGADGVEIVLAKAKDLQIEVRTSDGVPVTDYSVWFGRPRDMVSVERDIRFRGRHEHGRVLITDARSGLNVLRVFPALPSLRPSEPVTVDLSAPNAPTLSVVVERLRERDVLCVDADGVPVASVPVEVLDLVGDERPIDGRPVGSGWQPDGFGLLGLGSVKTGLDGLARLYVPEDVGSCALRVGSVPPVTVRTPLFIEGLPLRVVVARPGWIDGEVRDIPRGQAVEVVCEYDGERESACRVDQDGLFHLDGLRAGLHSLYLSTCDASDQLATPISLDGARVEVTVLAGSGARTVLAYPPLSRGSLIGRISGPIELPRGSSAALGRVGGGGKTRPVEVGIGGEFAFEELIPGRYYLSLLVPRSPAVVRPVPVVFPGFVDIAPGGQAVHDVNLNMARVVVHLVDSSGLPVDGPIVVRQGDVFPAGLVVGPRVVLEPVPPLPIRFGRLGQESPLWSEELVIPDGQWHVEATVVIPGT